MSALRPETRRLIELARHGDRPAPGAQRRVERALAAKSLLIGGAAAGGAMMTTSAAASSILAKPLVLVGIAIGVATGGYGGARLLGMTQPVEPVVSTLAGGKGNVPVALAQASRPHEVTSPSIASSEPAPARAAEPVAAVAPRVALNSPHPRPGEGPPSVDDTVPADTGTLRAETSALRAAQKALRDGDSARALELLGTEAALHPQGALVQERAAARVLALCQAGDVATARDEARDFEARYPTSPLLTRVKTACVQGRVAR